MKESRNNMGPISYIDWRLR